MSNVIGISAHFHDAACCLLKDGLLVAAMEEEKFSRRKHDPKIPKLAFNYCLEAGGICLQDVDVVAYFEQPIKKLARQIYMLAQGSNSPPEGLSRLNPMHPERDIREVLGYDGPIQYFSHHLSHAASAFYFSGFEEAAILTADGVGEWETTTYGRGMGSDLNLFESVDFPHSIGLLYSAITGYLGFEVNEGEYKVMGLASYGKAVYKEKVSALIMNQPKGQYQLNLKYFDFRSQENMYSENLIGLFGKAPRQSGEEIGDFHKDVARSLQEVIEDLLLRKVEYLYEQTGSENLCMAGGVALNCVANRRIINEGPFRRLFVQPAASDAGGCLGAAALAYRQLGYTPQCRKLDHAFWGPSFDSAEVAKLIDSAGLLALDFRGRESDMVEIVAKELSQGKIVGWFQGRVEFGPRALGGRSILADPRVPGMKDRINTLVKNREAFRPFAPAVLKNCASLYFDIDHPSPFMTETCRVISPISLPAITHVDGSARVQTVDESTQPRFASLLRAFERQSGCAVLLNTSFNMKDEPIVCSPIDALVCFIRSAIDLLVLEDFVIDRTALGTASHILFRSVIPQQKPVVSHHTYTLL